MSIATPSLALIAKAAEKSRQKSIVDDCELIIWREMRGRLEHHLGEYLAAHGDRAPQDLIDLQHELAALGRAPFGGNMSRRARFGQ